MYKLGTIIRNHINTNFGSTMLLTAGYYFGAAIYFWIGEGLVYYETYGILL